MGIHGLTKLLSDYAPGCFKEQKFDNYFGRKIAVDASMHIYQFMVVVGRVGDQLLTNEAGDVTSHLQGMFYRTAKMLEAGIKPVFVFDGKPPELKKAQLEQRLGRRDDAGEALKAAQESGDHEAVEKYSKRTVRVTKEHNEDCKRLLRLMGVPVLDAPSEAEAQCAEMCRKELVYGVATEDMDVLTFGSPRVIRHLMASTGAAAQAVTEFDRSKVLAELNLTEDQFIDLCILCGCDYANNIRGIGPVRALQMIQKHGTLEAVLEQLDPAKYPLPEPYPYKEAREFFKSPEVTPADQLPPVKWGSPDEEGLVAFLVNEKNFAEDRVRKTVAKIVSSKGKASQGRLESFFGPVITKPGSTPPAGNGKDAKKGTPGKGKDALGAKGGVAKNRGKAGGAGGSKKK